MKKINDLQEHLRNLLKPLFPASAYLKIRANKHLIIAIDWRLKSEGDLQDKFSRLIKIIISEEIVLCYEKKSQKQQMSVDKRIVEYVQERLKTFNPDHDTPRGGIPPQEDWVIDSKLL